jgi:hypothetical protein
VNNLSVSKYEHIPFYYRIRASLPPSENSASAAYRDPDESNLHPHIIFFTLLNIILPSMPRSPKWYPPFRIYDENKVSDSTFSHTRHIPCPFHLFRFDYLNFLWWKVKLWYNCLHLPVSTALLDPNILLSTLFSTSIYTKQQVKLCFYVFKLFRLYLTMTFQSLSTPLNTQHRRLGKILPGGHFDGWPFRNTSCRWCVAELCGS